MKRNSTILFTLFGVLCLLLFSTNKANAQKYKDPLSYMNDINKNFKKVSNDTWDYMRTVAHSKSARKIEKRRNDLIESLLKARKKIGSMPAYEGDISLRDSVVSYLLLSHIILKNDYDKILDMEKIAEESYDMMEAYLTAQELANDKLNKAQENADQAYKAFAEKHKITLINKETNRSRKVAIANKAFNYYNQIFLIHFKSSKQEAYLIEAFNQSDVLAMEQNKSALVSTAEEGLAILDTLKSFSGDGSLITGCRRMLNFYKEEGQKKAPIMIDFYMKKEKFEKISQAFENKRKKDRTQEDVDQYNKAINDYNKAINAYNATNSEVNRKRENKYKNWNIIIDNYFKRYVSKK